MDALARIAPPAVELLDRVDAVLAHAGAPADHPIWPLLRRLRALPGEAVAAFAPVTPESLAAATDTVHGLAVAYEREALPGGSGDWRGAGAESFSAQWQALRAHRDGLAERIRATASYLGALESWLAASRALLARTLAEVLTSAEAVEVHTATDPPGGPDFGWPAGAASADGRQVGTGTTPADGPVGVGTVGVARAAAEIAVRVLESFDRIHEQGERLVEEWRPRLDELIYRAPRSGHHARWDSTTEVAL
jgi:hypothetical protein